jgi:hypothetical protein
LLETLEGSGVWLTKTTANIKVGDRIAIAHFPCNAELVAVTLSKFIPLPEAISFQTWRNIAD